MYRRHAAGIAALAAAVITGAALGLGTPHTLAGAGGWAFVVLVVLYGYGALGRIALGADLLLGEQLAVGAIGWIAITGVLLAIGVASRLPILVLAGAGVILAFYDLVSRARGKPESSKSPIGAIVLAVLLGGFLAFVLLGTVASRGNPYDDHTAYMQFVARVLDCGDLVEPYSFRRLSAYGGQTLLLALAGARGDVETIDLLDRGIFQVVAMLLLLAVMRRRKVNLGIGAIVIVFVIVLWDLSINCASVWTGFTLFGAAYAFAARTDLAPRARLVLTLGACAAACTLRQNYLAPAGLFGILVLVAHLRAAGANWRRERTVILLAAGTAAAILLPYMIAAWRSNHTLLYPIFLGTGNPSAPLQPAAHTWLGEFAFTADVLLTPEPIRVWWLFVPAMLLARDVRPGKPFSLYALSCAFGFIFLIHSFTLSESSQLWRYAFGYLSPLAVMFVIEVIPRLPFFSDESTVTLELPSLAAFIVWLAVLAQIVESRNIPSRKLTGAAHDISAALELGSSKESQAWRVAHHELQRAIPEGATAAVMLDAPYLLDHERNTFVNLDIPGYAAPAGGLPSFQGPAALRGYFVEQGLRYVLFIDHDHASYLYRRDGWFLRMFRDGEIWQFIAAHMIDLEDNLAALATTSRVLYRAHGLYAIDLGTEPAAPHTAWTREGELAAMYAFIREKSETELGNNAWELGSRADVAFVGDGAGPSNVDVQLERRPQPAQHPILDAVQTLYQAPVPHRWLMDRTHVRLRGDGKPRHLRVAIDLVLDKLLTHPTVTFTLDGKELAFITSPADGRVVLDTDATCTGWCDLYIQVSTISDWWQSADWLRSVQLRGFRWDPK